MYIPAYCSTSTHITVYVYLGLGLFDVDVEHVYFLLSYCNHRNSAF
jgi:hypothetical protein